MSREIGTPAYPSYRQSTASDLGGIVQRAGAKYLMLALVILPTGADQQYPFKVPGNPLTEADYSKSAHDGGFTGDVVVGMDLTNVHLPTKASGDIE